MLMMWARKVSRSTTAAASRGSGKVAPHSINWDWHMFVWDQMRCELLILARGVPAGFRGGSAVC